MHGFLQDASGVLRLLEFRLDGSFSRWQAFVYAIWHECNWIKGVWKKIGLPVFFYAYHEAAIPLMQIET